MSDMAIMQEQETAMYREAQEAYLKVGNQLRVNAPLVLRLAQSLRNNPPLFVMICARGSSSHAGVYARYLIETKIGIPVIPVAPSLSSVFRVKQKLHGALFLAISQSGQSPDIIASAKAAKDSGARIIALVNDEHSPLADLADIVLPIKAGAEESVAATKTFICTLSLIVQLVANWEQNSKLLDDINALPAMLKTASNLKWDIALNELETAQSLFVVSRGLGLSIAKEAALKFKETCSLHAEAFSAAEIQHGPMALVKEDFPVLVFSTEDETQTSINTVAHSFITRSARVFATGKPQTGGIHLSTLNSVTPELNPIVTIQTFYRFINALALRRGFNPDTPEYLNKVTETI